MKRSTLLSYCCTALLLSACGPHSPGNDDTPDPTTPQTSTVSGKVVDGLGQPIANVSVLVLGTALPPATTDSTGAFSIPDVAARYDLALVSREKQHATVYRGITRRSSTLNFEGISFTSIPQGSHSATVSGSVSGGQTPYTDTNTPLVSFTPSPASAVSHFSAQGFSSGAAYSQTVSWDGAASLTGSVIALQPLLGPTYGVPTGYAGYGRRDNVTLTPEASVDTQDVQLAPVTNTTLGFKVDLPEGLKLLATSVSLSFSGEDALQLVRESLPTGTSFSYAVPQLPQTTLSALVYATDASSPGFSSVSFASIRLLTAGSSNTTLAVADFARPRQPVNSAKDVTHATDFSWSPVAGGVHAFKLQETTSSATSYGLTVFTLEEHTLVPDLSALGLPLPKGASLQWSVQALTPVASVDALLGMDLVSGSDITRFGVSVGSSRTLTTSSTP